MWTWWWMLSALAAPCEDEVVLARSLLPGGDAARISLSELSLAAASLTLDVRYGKDKKRPVIKQATLTAEYLIENGRDEVAWTMGVIQGLGRVGITVPSVSASQMDPIDVDRLKPTWSTCEAKSPQPTGASWLQELPTGPSRVVVTHRLEQAACRLRVVLDERWPAEAVQLRVSEAGPVRGQLTLPPGARQEGGLHTFSGAGELVLELPGC